MFYIPLDDIKLGINGFGFLMFSVCVLFDKYRLPVAALNRDVSSTCVYVLILFIVNKSISLKLRRKKFPSKTCDSSRALMRISPCCIEPRDFRRLAGAALKLAGELQVP